MKKYWIIVALVGLLSACVEEIVDINGHEVKLKIEVAK